MIRNTFSEARLHNLIDAPSDLKISWRPEVKTEEGFSADIYPWRYMSAQHLTKDICLTREMLCGHSADIVRT